MGGTEIFLHTPPLDPKKIGGGVVNIFFTDPTHQNIFFCVWGRGWSIYFYRPPPPSKHFSVQGWSIYFYRPPIKTLLGVWGWSIIFIESHPHQNIFVCMVGYIFQVLKINHQKWIFSTTVHPTRNFI